MGELALVLRVRSALLAGKPHPKTLRPVQCRALVMVAGMARTGSTWQVLHAVSSLSLLRTRWRWLGYWNHPVAIPRAFETEDQKIAWYDNEFTDWADFGHNTVAVYKSHGFDPSALRLCSATIVLLTSRCLWDQLRSIVAVGWLPLRIAALEEGMKQMLAHYRSWKRYTALELDYNWMVSYPNETLRLVMSYLALHLSLATRGGALARGEIPVEQFSLLWSENISGPFRLHKRVDQRFDFVETVAAVRRRLARGPPETDPLRLGLRWCMPNRSGDDLPLENSALQLAMPGRELPKSFLS